MLVKCHLCRECKNQDSYTLSGRALCFECAERTKERHRKWRSTEEGKAKNAAHHRAWTSRKIAEGLCSSCGRVKVENGRKVCKACVIQDVNNKIKRMVKAGVNYPRGSNGFCWQCNKEKAIEGKRLCQKCYDMKMNCLKGAREC